MSDLVLVQKKSSSFGEFGEMITIPKPVAEAHGVERMDRLSEEKFNEVMMASCRYGISVCNGVLRRNN